MFDKSELHLLDELLVRAMSELAAEIDKLDVNSYTRLSLKNTYDSLQRMQTKIKEDLEQQYLES